MGRKMSREAILQRERRIWELRTQDFMTQTEIAAIVGISQVAVSKILRRVAVKYGNELDENVKAIKAEQVAQLEYINAQAMTEWRRSKQPYREVAKRTSKKDKKDKTGQEPTNAGSDEQEATTVRSYEQTGDPRYLELAMKAMAGIRDITGASSPTKVAPTDPTGQREYAGLSNTQRIEKLAAIFKQVGESASSD